MSRSDPPTRSEIWDFEGPPDHTPRAHPDTMVSMVGMVARGPLDHTPGARPDTMVSMVGMVGRTRPEPMLGRYPRSAPKGKVCMSCGCGYSAAFGARGIQIKSTH